MGVEVTRILCEWTDIDVITGGESVLVYPFTGSIHHWRDTLENDVFFNPVE